MTGRSGQRFDQFLLPGELTDHSLSMLLDRAGRELPRPFIELIKLSSIFLQPVFDLAPARIGIRSRRADR
jgi:hypothetical protein